MKDTLASQNEQTEEGNNQALQLKTQLDAVVYFIERMDIEMINEILEDHLTYQDFPKAMFIHKLDVAFDEFKAAGNDSLNTCKGMCDSIKCSYGCPGFRFVGNHSTDYFELIFIHKEGQIEDIYECVDFKAKRDIKHLGKRIEIDRRNVPF